MEFLFIRFLKSHDSTLSSLTVRPCTRRTSTTCPSDLSEYTSLCPPPLRRSPCHNKSKNIVGKVCRKGKGCLPAQKTRVVLVCLRLRKSEGSSGVTLPSGPSIGLSDVDRRVQPVVSEGSSVPPFHPLSAGSSVQTRSVPVCPGDPDVWCDSKRHSRLILYVFFSFYSLHLDFPVLRLPRILAFVRPLCHPTRPSWSHPYPSVTPFVLSDTSLSARPHKPPSPPLCRPTRLTPPASVRPHPLRAGVVSAGPPRSVWTGVSGGSRCTTPGV